MTGAEAVGVLDEQLDASLAVFDGMILGERGTAAGIENSNTSDDPGSAGSNDEPLFEEGELGGGSGGTAVPGMPSGAGGIEAGDGSVVDGDSNGNRTEGDASGPAVETARADGGVPADIASGADDDIVARQIREAAMKEKDPVLREKLWDEYRKYKNQQ